jgi:hypothetical protein
MKRIAAIAVIGWLLVAGSTRASQVTNVEISYRDGFTVARIDIQGPVRFAHQTEVPKDGRPDRVIVDLLSATHELGAKEFLELPPCVITGIRSSQYAVSPERITRVVFDLSKTPVYRIESDDKSVSVYFNEKEPKSFAAWSTSSVWGKNVIPQPAIMAGQPPTDPAPKIKPKSVQARNDAIEQDRTKSLSNETKPAQPVVSASKDSGPTGTVSSRSFNQRLFSEGLGYAPSIQDMPQPSPEEEEYSETTPVAPKVVDQPKPTVAVSIPKPVDDFEADNRDEEVAPSPVKSEKKKVAQVEPPAKSTKTVPLVAPRTEWTPPMALVQDAPTKAAESIPKQKISKPIASAPASVQPKPSTPKTPVQVAEKSLPAELAEAPVVPAPGAARATARFRREVQSDKIRGTMVAEFPERLVIRYERAGQRDPFGPLIDDRRTFNAPLENRIPNVEGLKLVGIIDSDGGYNQALFEDKSGFSYILKTGDKVRNGYVLRVEQEQVYFQIFEYGWSRTVALTME